MHHYLSKILKFDVYYVFKNGSWLVIGNVFAIFMTLATSYIFANHLSPQIYGEYKYFLSLGTILTSFSLTGIAAAVTQGTAKKIPGFFYYASKIGLRYELFITAIAISGATYYYLQDNHNLALGLVSIAILQPLLNNSNLIINYLYGKENFRIGTISQIFKVVISSFTLIGTTLYFKDSVILLVSYLLSNLLINYFFRYLYKPKNSITHEDFDSKNLITYAKHTSVRNIFTNISGQVDKVLVFQNLSAADLAIYAFAIALPEQFKAITKSIHALLVPRFSRHNSENIKKNMFHKAMVYGCFLLVLTGSYIAAAPHIYKLLFPAYQESIFLSQVFSLITLTALGGLPTAALQASRNSAQLYKLDILTAIFQTLSMVTLFYIFGLIGVIYGRILGRFFATSLAFWLFFSTPLDRNTA